MRIWSKTCAGTCGLKRFISSWFIIFSVGRKRSAACRGATCRVPQANWYLLFRGLGGLADRAAALLLGIVQIDVEAERPHFLDQHVERFRDAGLESVVAAHNRLVHLGTSGYVIRLHRQHLLQGVG